MKKDKPYPDDLTYFQNDIGNIRNPKVEHRKFLIIYNKRVEGIQINFMERI